MKRLTILAVILLLSVCRLTVAQRYEGKLVYELRLQYFGIIPESVGAASISCQTEPDFSRLLKFYGCGSKAGTTINNYAEVLLDPQDRIQRIYHQTTRFDEFWEVNYTDSLIYHFIQSEEDSLRDTLKIISDYPPVDALAALFFLDCLDFYPGYTKEIFVLGRGKKSLKSSWKAAWLEVKGKTNEKILGERTECWKIEIRIDKQDNLFPGDQITLYVDAEKKYPVKVVSNFKPEDGLKKILKIIVPTKIVGELE